MELIVDNIALWRAKRIDSLTTNASPIGRPYKDRAGGNKVAAKPLYRYAKNYTVKDGKSKLDFSLFVNTFSTDSEGVEKALDKIAETVTPAQVREVITNPVYTAFNYLNVYLGD